MINLYFLGATGTVTGSKYLVETAGGRLLVDCGLFQGYKQLRLRNWAPPPVDPPSLDAVVLTHAHIDHSGYLPLLIRNGFAGPIYCTAATRDLCAILLPDSGYLQEKDAEYANRKGFSKHHPALPLYTKAEGEHSLESFKTVDYGQPVSLGEDISFELSPAGHILGSASVTLQSNGVRLTFSGDLGRPGNPTVRNPEPIRVTDYLVVESTYGDRVHGSDDPAELLARIVSETARRGGMVLIPSFAVGRTQMILYYLHQLKKVGRIPDLPVFLDSPMAIDAGAIFRAHPAEHGLSPGECRAVCATAQCVNSVEESMKLDQRRDSFILISASGMATGGRVLHHLKVFAPEGRNTILFAGFQAGGTRGAALVGGARKIKIHGGYVAVRAEVDQLDMLSAHADSKEVLDWLSGLQAPPREVFVTHGEPTAADALRRKIAERFGYRVRVPEYGEQVTLD